MTQIGRSLDVSNVGTRADADRLSIMTVMSNNRVYGQEHINQALTLAYMDIIVNDPKKTVSDYLIGPRAV